MIKSTLENVISNVVNISGFLKREAEELQENKVNIIIIGDENKRQILMEACFREQSEKSVNIPVNIYEKDIDGTNEIEDENIHCIWCCGKLEKNVLNHIKTDKCIMVTFVHDKTIQSLRACEENSYTVLIKKEKDEIIGKDELIKVTHELLKRYKNDKLIKSWLNATTNMELRREYSLKNIYQTLGLTAAATAIPIPVADYTLLIPIQLNMVKQILSYYNVNLTGDEFAKIFASLLGVGGIAMLGRTVFSSLIKMFPGAGSFVGGIIGVGTATVLTYALGRIFILFSEKIVYEGKAVSDIDENILSESMKKILNVGTEYIKNIGGGEKIDIDSFEKYMNKNISISKLDNWTKIQ